MYPSPPAPPPLSKHHPPYSSPHHLDMAGNVPRSNYKQIMEKVFFREGLHFFNKQINI